MQGYDPRAVANLLLDLADRRKMTVSNLTMQKLLYFAHGTSLMQGRGKLVSGYFEAWQFGPVHPAVYRAFKSHGRNPITTRAMSQDPVTGVPRQIAAVDDVDVEDQLLLVLKSYGVMTPGRLVDISHAKDSAWDYIMNKARSEVAFGLRIPDDVISSRFRYHIVSLTAAPRSGEPDVETPPDSTHRSGTDRTAY